MSDSFSLPSSGFIYINMADPEGSEADAAVIIEQGYGCCPGIPEAVNAKGSTPRLASRKRKASKERKICRKRSR